MLHSANWDKTVSLKGKRVAVIGSGSSAVQIIPNILDGPSLCPSSQPSARAPD